MKFRILIPLLTLHWAAASQTLESFDDGNFLQHPTWTGDTSFFFVNTQKQLQSKGPSSSASDYLSFPSSKIEETVWQFWIHLPYQPSTSNYAKVYLSSDIPNLKDTVHGYFIKVGGESGSTDGIDFYKQNGKSSIKLIDGISGHAGKSNTVLRIKVERDSYGNWSLYSDTTGGFDFSLEGVTHDTSYTKSVYTGIVYTHTSTRRNQFFFDDFIITPTPLKVNQVEVISSNEIALVFNRPVDSSLLDTAYYNIEKIGHPRACKIDGGNTKILLKFQNEITEGTYVLGINSIKNNVPIIHQDLSFYFTKPLSYGSLLISEIFPDPTPGHGLPEQEYIELYNSTSDTITLNSFTFSDPSTQSVLPDSTIQPNSYCILTSKEAAPQFSAYGCVVGISPWPSLNNDSDQLVLKDDKGRVIDKVDYSKNWFGKGKEDGGWSLEMINYKELCKGSWNWGSSVNPEGGTPGKANSIANDYQDTEGPTTIASRIADSISIEIQFNEPLDSTIDPRIFTIKEYPIKNVQLVSRNSIWLYLQNPIQPNSEISVVIHHPKDCLGNLGKDTSLILIQPDIADSLDIIINEILFNPKPGGYDFVEIYNRSGKILDLQNWKIQSVKNTNSISEVSISENSLLVKPFDYRAFTYSLAYLQKEYDVKDPSHIIELELPSFNDDEGTVRIVNPQGKIIDEFTYLDRFHSPLLKNHEGVSLERISFYTGTNIPSNWYSASSNAGYATPGYENSQSLSEERQDSPFSIEPKVITPNGDNYNDRSFFKYQFADPGNSVTIKIFSIDGRLIKTIAQNKIAGSEGFYFWDGTDDKGALAEAGIYIIWADFFNPSGSHSTLKNTVTVATDF